jgi:ribosome-binding factor A
MSKIRQQRTAEQMQHILSELFLREMNDPRLQMLTVTEVTIDRELEHADVYLNALGDESRQDEVMPALAKASGYLRRELVNRMRLRKAPQLHFHWDPRLAHTQEIESILNNLDIPPAENESDQTEDV